MNKNIPQENTSTTDPLLSEEQLKNLVSQLEPIMAFMPGYIFWKNTRSQYMWCNQNLADILGLKHRWEIYGKTDYDFLWDKKLIDQFLIDDQDVIRTGTTISKEYELPNIKVKGQKLYVKTEKRPLFDDKNQIIGVLGVTIDITDQKEAETERYLHSFVEDIIYNLPGYIFWKNKRSEYIGFNKNIVELSGLNRKTLLGKTDEELNWGENEAHVFRQDDEEVIKTGQVKITEHKISIQRTDGNYIVLRTEKSPLFDNKGNIIGVLAVAVDITEEKLLEEKLKNLTYKENQEIIYNLDSIIANMPGYIYWKNQRSEYMGCNNNLAYISGLKNRNEIIGKTDYDFEWGKEKAEEFRKDDQLVMEKKTRYITDYKLSVKREDGNFIHVRTEKMPLYDLEKNVIGVLAIALDITDQKILEENLRLQKEKIEQLSEAKTEFIRNMEHDIRTPFSGIYSLTKMLEESEENPEKKYTLSAITQCAKELLDYCNGILDFSKIESKTFPIIDKKFNLEKLIQNLIAMEKTAALQKNLKLIFDYPENLPVIFIGDEYRISRILVNLLSNAIKFTNQGFVKIFIEIPRVINDKNIIMQISIEDTGIGIPKEKINYIYEKFTRLSPSNEEKYKGMGIGLSIVKRLINEIEGEIEAASTPGKGSVFTCTFPLRIPLVDDISEECNGS